MAEGFARRYGSDVMEAFSAGIAPAAIVQPLTKKVMEAKNINIDEISPKELSLLDISGFDLIVNMTNRPFPMRVPIEVRDWKLEDPIGKEEETYVKVRDEIEMLVMSLILEFRRDTRRAEMARTGETHMLPERVARPRSK
ncbi:MAG: hypothetical protein JO108_18145 [Acidobacteriaceae bacterium]|nr:hypothetical protein [Acidobacteriaceae bacterium]